jgi:Uma2 family endonuclease
MANPLEQKQSYTFSEYEGLEEGSELRHEYYNGEVFAMAGGTKSHNLAVLNAAFALRGSLRGRDCRVFAENVRLELVAGKFYVYPDVMAVCNPDDMLDGRVARTPVLLIEVLSQSTEAYDRGTKLDYYLKLSSLLAYVLVSQQAYRVQVYARKGEDWRYWVVEGLDQTVHLEELAVKLPLAELYEGVDVEPFSR